jgi:hypothetical protein
MSAQAAHGFQRHVGHLAAKCVACLQRINVQANRVARVTEADAQGFANRGFVSHGQHTGGGVHHLNDACICITRCLRSGSQSSDEYRTLGDDEVKSATSTAEDGRTR